MVHRVISVSLIKSSRHFKNVEKKSPHVHFKMCFILFSLYGFGRVLFSSERLAVCFKYCQLSCMWCFNSLKSWVLWITLGEVTNVSSNRWSYHKIVLVCLCRKGLKLVFSKTTGKKKKDIKDLWIALFNPAANQCEFKVAIWSLKGYNLFSF